MEGRENCNCVSYHEQAHLESKHSAPPGWGCGEGRGRVAGDLCSHGLLTSESLDGTVVPLHTSQISFVFSGT